MAAADRRLRAALAADGSLFQGYDRRLRALHERNALRLGQIVDACGWPGADLVGEEAAAAAWLIAQHAISRPALQRRCLALLEQAVARGCAPRWQAAYLVDRIRTLEGRPQVFGTQLDWDDQGLLSPLPIEQPDGVDERRATVGLPPLTGAVEEQRRRAVGSGERPPADGSERQQAAAAFAREVGWRPRAPD